MASDKNSRGTRAEPGTGLEEHVISSSTTNPGTKGVIEGEGQVLEAAELLASLASANPLASESSGTFAEPFRVQPEKKRLCKSLSEKPPTNPKSNLADNIEKVDNE